MHIYANKKNIPTFQFGNLFIQGEKFADTVYFHTDRFYNNTDLLNCSFCIRGLTEEGWEVQQILIPQQDGDGIVLEWNVSDRFTYNSGKLSLEIRACEKSGDDENIIIKFNMQPVTVKATISGNNGVLPETAEQAVSDINQAAAEGISDIQNKADSLDFDDVKARLASAEAAIMLLDSQIRISAVTQEEYDSIHHKNNILYIIIEEE